MSNYRVVDSVGQLVSTSGTQILNSDDQGRLKVLIDYNPFSHGDLLGLVDDDHTQYTLADGSRPFTGTVGGVTPSSDSDLTTKQYVDDAITTATGSLTTDHGALTGLDDDDHTQYILADGTRELTGDWNAGDYTIDADGFTRDDTEIHLASYANITGLLTGGSISINSGDHTLLDVAAGTGIYVNMEDRDAPITRLVTWSGGTYDPTLSGVRSKWAAIDYNSDLDTSTVVFSASFSAEEKRSLIVLGRFWGIGTATITTAKNYATPAYSFGKSMEDITNALGAINVYGNVYTAAGSNLLLDRSTGRSFRFSANYDNNDISPNIYDSPASEPVTTYQYHLYGTLSTFPESAIDPNNYDLNGTKTAVSAGKWTAQRVYYFPVSNTTHIVYGQSEYDSETLAYDGVITNHISLNEAVLDGSILRAYVIVKQGCTDLADTNYARVISAYSDPGLLPGYTNHGQLGGLQDDDHPQYLLADGTRSLTGEWNYGSETISGTGPIRVGYIDLDEDITKPASKNARIFWDKVNHTVGIYNNDYDTTLQVGQEVYVRVYNDKAYTIPNGSVVYIDGGSGGGDAVPTVELSIASGIYEQDLGVATHDIAPGSKGFVTIIGVVNDVDTSAFSNGAPLYTSPTVSGALTSTKPIAPNRISPIGWCVEDDPVNGKILVVTKKSTALSLLSDVKLSGLANGNILVYNSTTQVWENETLSSDKVSYALPGAGGYPFNVDTALDSIYSWINYVGYSGRVFPESVVTASGSDVLIAAGAGFISDGSDNNIYITWDAETLTDAGSYTQGNWYIYVDSSGDIQTTQIFSRAFDIIRLGFFFSYGNGFVSSVIDSPMYINSAGNRVAETLWSLGPFIHDESGSLQVSSNNDLAITATQADVHWGLFNYTLLELDSVDDIDNATIRNVYQDISGVFHSNYWYSSPDGGNGIFEPDRWNDTTQSGSITLSDSFVFINGTPSVTVVGDYTSIISDDDYIYYQADGATYMTPITVSGVEFSGGSTTITLEGGYNGDSNVGNAVIIKALPRVPAGKYVKHIVFRVLDGDLIGVYGTILFDSEDDARSGALPDYPSSVKEYDVQLAYLIGSPDTMSWEGNIYDLRPLPFYREGGGGSAGGAVITSHSSLSNLSVDDHLQYLRVDGTRAATGKLRYVSHPTISADTDIVDKKYVDDKFPVDHGASTGLGDDDHTQYLLASDATNRTTFATNWLDLTDAGNTILHTHDSRYYTETELDNGQLDNRYYTETEVNGLLHSRQHAITSTADHTAGNWKVFYSNGSGQVIEVALGAADTVLQSNGVSTAPTFEDISLDTESAALQIRRSTDIDIPASWLDVAFDTVDFENHPEALELNRTITDRIDVKESGLYMFTAAMTIDATDIGTGTYSMRIVVNDTTVVPGSIRIISEDDELNDMGGSCFADLEAGDYVTFQIWADATGGTLVKESTYSIVSLQGVKGDKGDAGSGSTIHTANDGAVTSGGPFETLNFIGGAATLTDSTTVSGGVDIEINKTVIQIVRKTITTTTSTTATISINNTPTNTDGVAFDSLAITVTANGTNNVRIQARIPCDSDNDAGYPTALLIRDTTVLAVARDNNKKAFGAQALTFDVWDSPGSGSHTYYLRVGTENNESFFNESATDTTPFGGTAFTRNCTMTITEITA